MTTKPVDKPTKSDRPAASRRASGTGAKSTRDQAATTTFTKHAQLLNLLNRPEGASIQDMIQLTDWQQHSVRGFLAGTVKKKMGLALVSSKTEGDVRRYRIVTRRGR